MKKKLVLSLAAAALVGTLAVGGTLAWFTDTETATNVVTTGNVDIAWFENDEKITDKNPGLQLGTADAPLAAGITMDKKALVKNEGKNAAYIRVQIKYVEGEGTDKTESFDAPTYVDVTMFDSAKWVKDGNYYYYTDPVAAGASTDLIMSAVKIKSDVGNAAADKNLKIDLVADAIQSGNLPEGTTYKTAFDNGNIVSYDDETAPQA